jgi:hypothetical protein
MSFRVRSYLQWFPCRFLANLRTPTNKCGHMQGAYSGHIWTSCDVSVHMSEPCCSTRGSLPANFAAQRPKLIKAKRYVWKHPNRLHLHHAFGRHVPVGPPRPPQSSSSCLQQKPALEIYNSIDEAPRPFVRVASCTVVARHLPNNQLIMSFGYREVTDARACCECRYLEEKNAA